MVPLRRYHTPTFLCQLFAFFLLSFLVENKKPMSLSGIPYITSPNLSSLSFGFLHADFTFHINNETSNSTVEFFIRSRSRGIVSLKNSVSFLYTILSEFHGVPGI